MAPPSHSSAAELTWFWDLKREHLRILIAAPQVMVTRTASGWDAYCRCPVVLKPQEIPEAMKKAIIAVEDRRYMDHDGVDLIALASVLRGGEPGRQHYPDAASQEPCAPRPSTTRHPQQTRAQRR